MPDPFTAFQTATSAIAVIDLTFRAYNWLKAVGVADSRARSLAKKTKQLHRVLQDIEAIRRLRTDKRGPEPLSPDEIRINSNIRASVDACRKVLLTIDRKVRGVAGEDASRAFLARVQYTLKESDVAQHVASLENHVLTLQTSFQVLQFLDQLQATTRQRQNHGELLGRFDSLERVTGRLEVRLEELIAQTEGNQILSGGPGMNRILTGSTVPILDADQASDDIQAMKECIQTANIISSEYQPDPTSLSRFRQESPYTQRAQDDDDMSENDGSTGSESGTSDDDILVDSTLPLPVMDEIIVNCRRNVTAELEDGNLQRAEESQKTAIRYLNERQALYNRTFDETAEILSLAKIYLQQRKFEEAKNVVLDLLRSRCEVSAETPTELRLQLTDEWFLMATIHWDMYEDGKRRRELQQTDEQYNDHLGLAMKFAQGAFNARYKILGATDPLVLQTRRMLANVHEALGNPMLARFWDSTHAELTSAPSAMIKRKSLPPALPTPSLYPRPLSPISANSCDEDGLTPLIATILSQGSGRDERIYALLRLGADANIRCKDNKTPLMYAVEIGCERTVRRLIGCPQDHRADINATTEKGETALHQAVVRGDKGMVRLLLDLDAKVDTKNEDLNTPLLSAVQKNNPPIVALLLQKGADMQARGKDGWTVLHYAVSNDSPEILDILLFQHYPSRTIDVDAADIHGKTALHYAAKDLKIRSATRLLVKGANVDATYGDGITPLKIVTAAPPTPSRREFVMLLLEHHADVNNLPIIYKSLAMRQRVNSGLEPIETLSSGRSSTMSDNSSNSGETRNTARTSHSRRSFNLLRRIRS